MFLPTYGEIEPYLAAGVVLLLTWLAAYLVGRLVASLTRRSAPVVALASRRAASGVVWIIGVTVALQEVGISPDVLILVIAVVALGLVLALRVPLENAAAKYFSDSYLPFKIGDSIKVAGVSGKVIEMNAVTTVLLADNRQLVSVPNAVFLREVVVNTTPDAWKELTVPVTIGAEVDLPAFESELIRSLSKLKLRLDPRFPPVLTTRTQSPQSTDLLLTLMVRRPEEREALMVEVNQRVAETLKRARTRRA